MAPRVAADKRRLTPIDLRGVRSRRFLRGLPFFWVTLRISSAALRCRMWVKYRWIPVALAVES